MAQHQPADEKRSREELLREVRRLRRRLAAREAADDGNEERRRALERRLFRQREALVRLALSEDLARYDFPAFARLAAKVSAETLDVARVGVWRFNEDRTILRCDLLYERRADAYSEGTELLAEQHPRYFAALERGRRVAAHDAHQDPDTAEFSADYLTPLGISSMLDAPLRQSGELIGAVCHEHVGPARVWAPEEQDFASSVADFLALALEGQERRRAERAFRSAQEELLRRQWQATKQVEAELAAALRRQERRRGDAPADEAAASVSHRLRDSLEAIRAAVRRLSDDGGADRAAALEQVRIIEREILAADGILDRLAH